MKMPVSALIAFLAAMPAPAQISAKDRMVIMISLDGFPGYILEDPKMPIPALHKLMANGVSTRMHIINPTVTWPNHTTMVTGVRADQHGLLVNGSLVPTGSWPPMKVDPYVEKEKMVHVPTVYDAGYNAGLTTAQIDWVAITNANTITWAFAEWASPEGALEKEMIAAHAIPASVVEGFTKNNILVRDQTWTKAAQFLITHHKPNLMLLHFLSLDSVHHQNGPRSLAGTAAIAFLDSCVEKVVNAVHEAGMESRTTFLIVSDHGFKAYTKQIRPSIALANAGLANDAYVLPEGGSAIVYLKSKDVLAKTLDALKDVEGIESVVRPEAYGALGLPTPENDSQMGQLLLTAKSGYSFSGATGGPVTAAATQASGSHGYVASDPEMDAIFIASGYGVKSGIARGPIDNIDVAPTVAKLLGVSLPMAKGKALPILK